MSVTVKYGKGNENKKIVSDEDIVRPVLDEYSPYNELCKFAEEYKFTVELDKPFEEMNQMMLAIKDVDGNVIKKVTLEDIHALDIHSGKILNELGKKYK